MKDDKAVELFQKILAKARDHAIKWEATAEDGTYIASLNPQLQLKVWPYTGLDDGVPDGPSSITLNDGRGKLLLDITHRIDGILPEELEELSILARRSALNVDEKINRAIKTLDELVGDSDMPF